MKRSIHSNQNIFIALWYYWCSSYHSLSSKYIYSNSFLMYYRVYVILFCVFCFRFFFDFIISRSKFGNRFAIFLGDLQFFSGDCKSISKFIKWFAIFLRWFAKQYSNFENQYSKNCKSVHFCSVRISTVCKFWPDYVCVFQNHFLNVLHFVFFFCFSLLNVSCMFFQIIFQIPKLFLFFFVFLCFMYVFFKIIFQMFAFL